MKGCLGRGHGVGELNSSVGANGLDFKRHLSHDFLEELEAVVEGQLIVDAQDPQAGAVIDGGVDQQTNLPSFSGS